MTVQQLIRKLQHPPCERIAAARIEFADGGIIFFLFLSGLPGVYALLGLDDGITPGHFPSREVQSYVQPHEMNSWLAVLD